VSRHGQGILSLLIMYRPFLGHTQPPIKRVAGFFSEVKWSGREVDHLAPSAEADNVWISTSTAPYAFTACIGTFLPLIMIDTSLTTTDRMIILCYVHVTPQGNGENCIMRSLMICTSYPILFG